MMSLKRFLLIIALLFWAPLARGTACTSSSNGCIQFTAFNGNSPVSITLNGTVAGHAIFVMFIIPSTGSPAITGTNTYTKVADSGSFGSPAKEMFYFASYNIVGGNETITYTLPGFGTEGFAAEYSVGTCTSACFDQSSFNSTTSTSITSGSTATTSAANEVLVGFNITVSAAVTASGGYTNQGTGGSAFFDEFQDLKVSSTGSYASTSTAASTNYYAGIATFKLAPSTVGGTTTGGPSTTAGPTIKQ
jgi:hypothetical protein